MIVPNISFDPEIDDLSSLFTSVFNRVEKQLELYDKVETKFQESLKYNETNKLKAKISKVRTNIISSQNQTDLVTKEVDSMNQWMLSLEEQQKAIMKIDNIKIPNDFIKKFGTNATMIKEFEHDLLFYLRNQINFYETPQVLRLKECYKRSFKIKIDRLEVYESISDRCQQAEKKFIEVDAENKNLTAECQKSDETLAQFSTSEAYSLVQKAKRQKFIIEDWSKRKKEILDQIDTLKIDLEMYQEDNKDKSSNTSITRKVQEVEEDYNKSLSKWNEQIRLVEEDFKVSITHQQSMMKQLEKDLLSNQLQLLASEKKKTITEFRSMQASSTRTVSKFTSNRHSLNRKIEASFRKKALSFKDAFELLKTFHNESLESLKTTMDGVIEDIRKIILMRKNNSDNSTSSYLTKIQNQIELLRATTETAKRRINMKNIETDIELKAVNNRLVTVQGVVNDVIEHCTECENHHNELEEKLREVTAKRNEFCMNAKREIEQNQTFINSLNFIIIRLNDSLEKAVEKSNERNNGDSFIFSQKFKEKTLKRSFSMCRFKKLTFREIVNYRDKRRIEQKKKNPIINQSEIKVEKSDKIETSLNSDVICIQKVENKSNFQLEKEFSNEIKNKEISSNKNESINITNPKNNQEKSEDSSQIISKSIQKVDLNKESEKLNENKNQNENIKELKESIEQVSLDKDEKEETKPIEKASLNKEEKKDENSTEKVSNSNSQNLHILTPQKKQFLIPQPPTALSPLPPAKRKLVTISSSAASLCGQLAIIDTESSAVVERGAVIDLSENKPTRMSAEIQKMKEKEIPIKKASITSKKSDNNIECKVDKNSEKVSVNEIKKTASTTSNSNDKKVTDNSNNLTNIKPISNDSIKQVTSLSSSSSSSLQSLSPQKPQTQKEAAPLPSEKVKNKQKLKNRPKSRESVTSLSSSSSSSNRVGTIQLTSNTKSDNDKEKENEDDKNNGYKEPAPLQFEKSHVKTANATSSNDQIPTENISENSSQSKEKVLKFLLKNPAPQSTTTATTASSSISARQPSAGRIIVDYDHSLTASLDKKKKRKVSVSPRRKKPPKQIPNEQPSFVNNRPPRHLTLSNPTIYKSGTVRIQNNGAVNYSIVNINDTLSNSIQIRKNGLFSRFDELTKNFFNEDDNEQSVEKNEIDVIECDQKSDRKIAKKRSKKLSVKKKSKKSTENNLKRKKLIDQKINGKVLAFSLPTAERRAFSVKNVPRNGVPDSIRSSGSVNLNNRINGSIISVKHF